MSLMYPLIHIIVMKQKNKISLMIKTEKINLLLKTLCKIQMFMS